jgi:hypothetical protein
MSTRFGLRCVTGAFIAVLAASTLSSCTSVHDTLGTRDGQCFGALAPARQVIGTAPTFAGVRYLAPNVLDIGRGRHHHHEEMPAGLARVRGQGACLVGYRGRFSKKILATGWDPERGAHRFAVVVVRLQDHHVLGIVLLPGPPVRFSHLS